MEQKNKFIYILPVMFGFFIMGFCDLVGISVTYAKEQFQWTETQAGFLPSMVFLWFFILSVPTAMLMNRIGRKNTVLLSMLFTFALFSPSTNMSSASAFSLAAMAACFAAFAYSASCFCLAMMKSVRSRCSLPVTSFEVSLPFPDTQPKRSAFRSWLSHPVCRTCPYRGSVPYDVGVEVGLPCGIVPGIP